MRFPLFFASFLLLITFAHCSSGSQRPVDMGIVSGTIRYQEGSQLFESNIQLRPRDSSTALAAPTLFNFPMDLVANRSDLYKYRHTIQYPSVIPIGLPFVAPDYQIDLAMAPVNVGSFPDSLLHGTEYRTPIGDAGLSDGESLTFFFEPADRSAPQRIRLLGPTASNEITLPKDATDAIPAGRYDLYLVKDKLIKDSTAVKTSFQLSYYTRTKPVIVVNEDE